MEQQMIKSIHDKEFKAVLKELVKAGEFPKDILFNGAKREYILIPYELQEDLSRKFKSFINENIIYCQTHIVEYILYNEGDNKPFEIDDILNEYEFNEEEFRNDLLNDYGFLDIEEINKDYNRRIKTRGDFEVFLNSLDEEELKEYNEKHTDLNECEYHNQTEVYEWWLVSSWLHDLLNYHGEVVLNGNYWGRCTTGQSIELDGVMQNIFLKWWCE